MSDIIEIKVNVLEDIHEYLCSVKAKLECGARRTKRHIARYPEGHTGYIKVKREAAAAHLQEISEWVEYLHQLRDLISNAEDL